MFMAFMATVGVPKLEQLDNACILDLVHLSVQVGAGWFGENVMRRQFAE